MSEPGSGDVHVPSPDWRGKKPKKKDVEKQDPRKLEPLDSKRSKTPFAYEGNVLGTLREDQVPRFFGALTDSQDLPAKTVKLSDLTALQNRVDTAKVKAIAENGAGSKLPVVIQHEGKKWIADGHHRLAAAWLSGEESAKVRFKNLEPEVNTMKAFDISTGICKVDDNLGLVMGFAIVCKKDGQDYFDVQGDHIPEDAMLGAAVDFMQNSRVAKEMHAGDQKGAVLFAFPLTAEIAKSFGIETKTTGLMIAMKPDDPAMLAKFKDGTYTGFSIGGRRITDEDVQ